MEKLKEYVEEFSEEKRNLINNQCLSEKYRYEPICALFGYGTDLGHRVVLEKRYKKTLLLYYFCKLSPFSFSLVA